MEAIAVQRLAHEIFQRKIPLIPRIMTEWAHSRTGIDLHPGARIGSHFFIDHGTGTVVGETSVIGNHVKMYQGVALIGRSLKGGQSLRGVKRHPTIEDKVTLYANATVMGGDTIVGARSTIGANVFLTQSIPPDSLAITDEVSVKIMIFTLTSSVMARESGGILCVKNTLAPMVLLAPTIVSPPITVALA